MENKYFTPDIEDMSIGCEYELYHQEDGWKKVIFSAWENFNYDAFIHCLKDKEVRVPYLTKELIENEGWHSPEVYRDGGTLVYKKDKHEITFRGENRMTPSTEIVITELFEMMDRTTRHILFKGHCKDINTFRKIIKLLGI
jgi:hypothetical protein